MKLRWSVLALVAGLCALAVGAGRARAPKFYLRDGDRVVFYGDSITEQALYTADIESYVVTRFPSLSVSFTNSGWSGDRATMSAGGTIAVRLGRDVFAYRPSVVTVMLGMNDGEYKAWDPGVSDAYSNGYAFIVDAIRKALPHARVTLLEPSPFDDVTRPPEFAGGYNAVLIRYGQFDAQLARREDLAVADLDAPLVQTLDCANKANPGLARRIIPDRVHPAPPGHLIMAEALLKAWNAPSLVSEVEIDAAKHRVTEAANTEVSLLPDETALAWNERDGSLPLPLNRDDPVTSLVLRCSDFVAALDQEMLRVTGLKAAQYVLQIDGVRVGGYTRQQLADGLNLALDPTPMERQAAAVYDLARKHNQVHFARWRSIQVLLDKDPSPEVANTLASLDRLEAALVGEERAAAEPKSHRFELIPL